MRPIFKIKALLFLCLAAFAFNFEAYGQQRKNLYSVSLYLLTNSAGRPLNDTLSSIKKNITAEYGVSDLRQLAAFHCKIAEGGSCDGRIAAFVKEGEPASVIDWRIRLPQDLSAQAGEKFLSGDDIFFNFRTPLRIFPATINAAGQRDERYSFEQLYIQSKRTAINFDGPILVGVSPFVPTDGFVFVILNIKRL